jgi:NAD(P)-dependent dehydrogenase (short-subunit alcohol dehydrogenase family)
MTRQPVALVTGTSSGIGLWTAIGLAAAGSIVVATMRDPSRAGALLDAASEAGVKVDVRALDVTDRGGSSECVQAVSEELGGIDVLVNNAGRGSVATLEQLDDAALQEQLDVNYLGVAALTRLVLPRMRVAGAGRIVTVTSVGGAVGQPFADAYCGAKFAVEGLMQSLAPVAARFGIDVCIVEPAAVGSVFVTNTGVSNRSVDPQDPYGLLLDAYLRRTESAFAAAQHPRDAAATVVEAATTRSPKFRWQTSPTAAAFAGLSLADLDGARVLEQTAAWLG